MDLSFQEKSVGSTLTIIVVGHTYGCGRLLPGVATAEVSTSAMPLCLYRRGR